MEVINNLAAQELKRAAQIKHDSEFDLRVSSFIKAFNDAVEAQANSRTEPIRFDRDYDDYYPLERAEMYRQLTAAGWVIERVSRYGVYENITYIERPAARKKFLGIF